MLCCCDKPDTSDPITPPVAAPEDQKPDNGSQDQEEGALPMVIVGYATYWDSVMPDPTLLTHINYAFAHIKNDFETLDIKTPSRLKKIVALKEKNPDLQVMLSI
jgi:GH18 family chitinase